MHGWCVVQLLSIRQYKATDLCLGQLPRPQVEEHPEEEEEESEGPFHCLMMSNRAWKHPDAHVHGASLALN